VEVGPTGNFDGATIAPARYAILSASSRKPIDGALTLSPSTIKSGRGVARTGNVLQAARAIRISGVMEPEVEDRPPPQAPNPNTVLTANTAMMGLVAVRMVRRTTRLFHPSADRVVSAPVGVRPQVEGRNPPCIRVMRARCTRLAPSRRIGLPTPGWWWTRAIFATESDSGRVLADADSVRG
jgi:hypothetical protein